MGGPVGSWIISPSVQRHLASFPASFFLLAPVASWFPLSFSKRWPPEGNSFLEERSKVSGYAVATCKDMCIRVHMCIHVCVYMTHMCAHECVMFIYNIIHVCIILCTYVYAYYVCICACVCVGVHVSVCMCVGVHTHMQRQASIIPKSGHNPVIHSPRICRQVSRDHISHSRSPTYCVPLGTSPNTF